MKKYDQNCSQNKQFTYKKQKKNDLFGTAGAIVWKRAGLHPQNQAQANLCAKDDNEIIQEGSVLKNKSYYKKKVFCLQTDNVD